MDLERLQVVISAKTDQLQKALKDVTNKLGNVNNNVNSTEKQFNDLGDAGVKAFNKIINASKEYSKNIQSIAKYMAQNDIWETKPPSGVPWRKSLGEIKKEIKDYEAQLEGLMARQNEIFNRNSDEDISTFEFGMLQKEIGDTRDALTQFKAVRDELLADKKDNFIVQLTPELRDLAVESAKVKQQLAELLSYKELYEKAKDQSEANAGPITREQLELLRQCAALYGGPGGLDKRISALAEQYAGLRREIDNTIEIMGGLVPQTKKLATLEAIVVRVRESFKSLIQPIQPIISAFNGMLGAVSSGVIKVTKGIGNMI